MLRVICDPKGHDWTQDGELAQHQRWCRTCGLLGYWTPRGIKPYKHQEQAKRDARRALADIRHRERERMRDMDRRRGPWQSDGW